MKNQTKNGEMLKLNNTLGLYNVEINYIYLNNCGRRLVIIATDNHNDEVYELWYDDLSRINLHEPSRVYGENNKEVEIVD